MRIKQSAIMMAAKHEESKAYDLRVTASGDRYWVNGSTSPKGDPDKEAENKLSGWTGQSATLELSQRAETKEEAFMQKGHGKNGNKKLSEEEKQKAGWIKEMADNRQTKQKPIDTEEDFKIKMLRQLLESLRAMQGHRRPNYMGWGKTTQQAFGYSASAWKQSSFSIAAESTKQAAAKGTTARVGVGHWEERVTMSKIYSEKEVTSFSTMGVVETSDGRSINFNLNLEMSREFTQAVGLDYSRKTFCVDPLVINLEGNPASFSDQTFFFDLDSDGKAEELSSLAKGSGFLALDLNNDGVINDGSELFGTKSGDGFKDLAAYDKDGNGWIDEDDEVFKHLKVWTKDADGRDRLIALGDAGVGAIYLGHTATEFSVKQMETNQTQGIVRSTGVFLKESGEVGTIQHVDLVI